MRGPFFGVATSRRSLDVMPTTRRLSSLAPPWFCRPPLLCLPPSLPRRNLAPPRHFGIQNDNPEARGRQFGIRIETSETPACQFGIRNETSEIPACQFGIRNETSETPARQFGIRNETSETPARQFRIRNDVPDLTRCRDALPGGVLETAGQRKARIMHETRRKADAFLFLPPTQGGRQMGFWKNRRVSLNLRDIH